MTFLSNTELDVLKGRNAHRRWKKGMKGGDGGKDGQEKQSKQFAEERKQWDIYRGLTLK